MHRRAGLLALVLAGACGKLCGQATGTTAGLTSARLPMNCAVAGTSVAGSTPEGFGEAGNVRCGGGFVQPDKPGTAMFLQRALAPNSVAENFAITARMSYVPGANIAASMGFDAAPANTRNTDPAKHILLTAGKDGFALDNQGNNTVLLPAGGATSGVRGSTDSGVGLGWVAPPAGTYDASMIFSGAGTLIVSLMARDTPENSYSFRLAGQTLPVCDAPCGELGRAGGLQNLEVGGVAAADRVGTVAYTTGPASDRLPLPPHDAGGDGVPLLLRFPTAGNVWAWLPARYAEGTENKWVLAEHGFGETGQAIQQAYLPVTSALLRQGYTIVSIENTHENCWGNRACVADLAAALNVVRTNLAVADQPYGICDSMGCLTLLNAVSQGVLKLKAGVLICGNTNLAWDFKTGGARTGIAASFGVTDGNSFEQATAASDPMTADEAGRANLATVPWMLFSSPGDRVVSKIDNTDAFAKLIDDAGGKAAVVFTAGNHEDASNFDGARVLAFFGAH